MAVNYYHETFVAVNKNSYQHLTEFLNNIPLLKDYNYKAAFGQHSGVINETSNFSYLPRFSLNEKYGNIDRVVFTANSKGLGIYDFVPENPTINDNPPYIGFSLLNQFLSKTINCFIFDSKGEVESEIFPEDASFVSIEDALREEAADEADDYI